LTKGRIAGRAIFYKGMYCDTDQSGVLQSAAAVLQSCRYWVLCTKFGADSSSRFPIIARTNRQTRRRLCQRG